MLKHLKKISETVDSCLRADPFLATIQPEYLKTAVADYPLRGGKRLRPAILIWCCQMLGGEESQALYPALAAEVGHNWTLVHDDIIDQDDTRHNRPSCHIALAGELSHRFNLSPDDSTRTGRDFAILTGDVQQGWANHLLLRSVETGVRAQVVLAVARRFQELANRDLICGESLDVEFSLRQLESITPSEVRTMLQGKTGALLRFCAEAGAMIALDTDDQEAAEVKKLGDFALAIGNAFQLRDDYLGIFGDPTTLGKPIGGDLREGKATILLLTTLKMAKREERTRLLGLINRREYSSADIETAQRIMRDSGAVDCVNREAVELIDKARGILMEFPENIYRQCLLELVDYLIDRKK